MIMMMMIVIMMIMEIEILIQRVENSIKTFISYVSLMFPASHIIWKRQMQMLNGPQPVTSLSMSVLEAFYWRPDD